MIRVAIIGGGISGLSAAYTLEKRRRNDPSSIEYVLYEAAPRLGGVLQTEHIDHCVVEAGPDSFLTEKSWATEFCRELGLGDQLIGSNDSSRKTYIVRKGRLVEIPDGLMFMVPTKILPAVFSSLFSWNTKLKMAQEFLRTPEISDCDESVASFVERHYGAEMVDQLADPLLSGIYGGSANDLSVRAVLPRFVEMEKAHGSLGRAMVTAKKKTTGAAYPLFTSLRNGMEQLALALLSQIPPAAISTNAPVTSLYREESRWIVVSGDKQQQFDAVIVATAAYVASALTKSFAAGLAAELSAIPYTSSIIVALGYDANVRRRQPPGFGFLVPRSEGHQLLAATFVHNKFPHRAPPDRALLRCFLAGADSDKAWSLTDTQIVEIICRELKTILRIHDQPQFARVYRWKSAMAQYAVGHLERMTRIESLMRQLPRFTLAGNAYRGIGIPDCIRSGSDAADYVLT